jgi:hypothetical protein
MDGVSVALDEAAREVSEGADRTRQLPAQRFRAERPITALGNPTPFAIGRWFTVHLFCKSSRERAMACAPGCYGLTQRDRPAMLRSPPEAGAQPNQSLGTLQARTAIDRQPGATPTAATHLLAEDCEHLTTSTHGLRSGRAGVLSAPAGHASALPCVSRREPNLAPCARTSSNASVSRVSRVLA